MAKFKDIVRFAPIQLEDRAGYGTRQDKGRLRLTLQQIEGWITAEPGISAGEIAHKLGSTTIEDDKKVAARLFQALRTKKPRIKRLKQDGKFRYYPMNHLAGTTHPVDINPTDDIEKVTNEVKPDENVVASERNEYIVHFAKEFYWEIGTDSLREFINWLEKN